VGPKKVVSDPRVAPGRWLFLCAEAIHRDRPYNERMNERWQFTTRYLLLEVLLVAVGLGLGRLAWTSYSHYSSFTEAILFPPSVYGMLACFGGAIGGLFGRHLLGAFWAIGGFLIGYLLIAASMVAYTLMFA
jgi:hypothetical protein